MASGKAEASIARNPDDVWKLIREFGALAEFMPGVDTCTVDGDVRTVGTMGIEVKEQLRELDDDTRRISYSVIESPMTNMVSHLATISVDAEGNGTHLTWAVEVEPDELLALFQGVYEGSVAALKEQLELMRRFRLVVEGPVRLDGVGGSRVQRPVAGFAALTLLHSTPWRPPSGRTLNIGRARFRSTRRTRDSLCFASAASCSCATSPT